MREKKYRPEYLNTYQTRPESENFKQLNKAVAKVGTVGVRNMDRVEMKQVGLPIIREARARMRQLEEHGLTDSPAYRHIKQMNISMSTAGKDLNKIKQNVMAAYEFLHAKTSTVEGASNYNEWLDEHLGMETSTEQREKIWDLIHRFEETHPQQFMNYGYDEAIKRIAKMARKTDYDIDEAYARLEEFLKSTGELHDIDEVVERKRMSPWYRGRSSTIDF